MTGVCVMSPLNKMESQLKKGNITKQLSHPQRMSMISLYVICMFM